MMEGPRHQHLHQEWQEPLKERSQLLELTLTHTQMRRVCKAQRKAALAAVEHRGAALSEAPEFRQRP